MAPTGLCPGAAVANRFELVRQVGHAPRLRCHNSRVLRRSRTSGRRDLWYTDAGAPSADNLL